MKKLYCLLISAMLLFLQGLPVFAQEEFVRYELSGLVYEVPAEWEYKSVSIARNHHASQDGKKVLDVSFAANSEGALDAALEEIQALIPDADTIDLQTDAFEGVRLSGETSGGTWINAACIANGEGCLTLMYSNEDSEEQSEEFDAILDRVSSGGAPYIGNRNTDKFHYASCSSVDDMKEKNKVDLYSREEAIEGGYVPCKRCNP